MTMFFIKFDDDTYFSEDYYPKKSYYNVTLFESIPDAQEEAEVQGITKPYTIGEIE